jgi:cyclase
MMLRRVLVFLPVLFCMTLPLFAQQQVDWDKIQIKVQKLSETVYMLQGQGANIGMGNIAALVDNDSIVLVDCELAELGPKIEAALKMISSKPVRYVVNTHWHGDHVGGNAYFGKTAVVIAQDNVRKRMETVPDPRITNLGVSLPIITFSDQLTLHTSSSEIHAVYFPHGHTDGDSLVFFPQANVVHMGDDFTNFEPNDLVNFEPTRFPAISWENDETGGVQGPIAAAEYVLAHLPDDVKIIPGHGNVTSKKYVARYLALLKATSAVVQAGIDQGKGLDQLKQEKVLAKWDYLEKNGGMKSEAYLERLYKSLTEKSDSATNDPGRRLR